MSGGCRRVVTFAIAVQLLAGCAAHESFVRDDALHVDSPAPGARVSAPLVVRWHVDPQRFRPVGFDGTRDPDRGAFAVFVDRPPMAPGDDVDSLADGDRACQTTPHCPDRPWLESRGVYLTTRPRVVLRALPAGGGEPVGALRRHDITIVLLNGRAERIGESAWTLSVVTGPRAVSRRPAAYVGRPSVGSPWRRSAAATPSILRARSASQAI